MTLINNYSITKAMSFNETKNEQKVQLPERRAI